MCRLSQRLAEHHEIDALKALLPRFKIEIHIVVGVQGVGIVAVVLRLFRMVLGVFLTLGFVKITQLFRGIDAQHTHMAAGLFDRIAVRAFFVVKQVQQTVVAERLDPVVILGRLLGGLFGLRNDVLGQRLLEQFARFVGKAMRFNELDQRIFRLLVVERFLNVFERQVVLLVANARCSRHGVRGSASRSLMRVWTAAFLSRVGSLFRRVSSTSNWPASARSGSLPGAT